MAQPKVNVKVLVLVVGFIGALASIPFAGRALLGGGAGEKCGKQFGCKLQHTCISNTCRQKCSTEGDCEAGWGCRPTAIEVTSYKGSELKGISNTSMKICLSPEAMVGVLAKEAARKANKQREGVRLRVITKMIRPPLSDQEFDDAWGELREDEVAAGSVEALATRVITLARQPPQP